MAGFLLGAVVTLLNCLRRLSVDFWIRQGVARNWFSIPRRSDLYVDGIVVADLLLSLLIFHVLENRLYERGGERVGYVLVVIAVYRILDVVSFQARQLLAGSGNPGGRLTHASYERTLLLTFLNFITIAVWFACCYAFLRNIGLLAIKGSLPEGYALLRESIMMMVLNSTDAFENASAAAYRFFIGQILIGLFMTTIIISRTINSLTNPKLDSDETN